MGYRGQGSGSHEYLCRVTDLHPDIRPFVVSSLVRYDSTHDQAHDGLATILIITVCVALMTSGCSKTNRTESPEPALQQQEVTVVVSGDTRGWIIPCGCTSGQSGGLLRRATFVNQQKQRGPVIVLDAGGAPDGSAPYQKERFRAILKGEAAMDLAAHNIGSNEAAFGVSELKSLSLDTDVTFVSANTTDSTGQSYAESHVLLYRGGQKVLVTGVLSPSFASSNVVISEPASAVLSVIDRVKGDFDRVIVLAWLPVDELRQLAETLPEADLIVGGPTGQSLAPEKIGAALLTSATNKGKFVARVVLPASGSDPLSAQVVELTPEFDDDNRQKDNLEQFRKFLADRDFRADETGLIDPSVSRSAAGHEFAGSLSCAECHEESHSAWTDSGHAHAWERLISEGAQVDPYCQQCHTTGYGMPDGFVSIRMSEHRTDVSCESCHGPSKKHVADSSVKTPLDAAGICLKCHDPENSPLFKYDTYWEKVRHE